MLVQLIGGIGLFLLGMVLLTEGLRAYAGDSLRRALLRFTGRPVTAFVSGAITTALVQSSSATTLATIGFVSAGLLTFPQAIGVLFGASLGTTGTGWLVSVFGFKFSIGTFALPLVGVGAFLKLLGRGRWNAFGLALAGFGLIFVGIDYLQEGMAGVPASLDLAALPARGFAAHAAMVLAGVFLTVIMQSSSAAIATTLAALHAGAIAFDQAASLVIGAAIGTTVTAALAAIGAGAPARRTAAAHVVFNLATGLLAFALLPLFLRGLAVMDARFGLGAGPVALAAFHTAFISLGVLLFLPFSGAFARGITRLIPDTGPQLTRYLDESLLGVPGIATEAVRKSLQATAADLGRTFSARLSGELAPEAAESVGDRVRAALEECGRFLERIPATEYDPADALSRSGCLHAVDHLHQALPLLRQRHSAGGEDLAEGIERAGRVLSMSREALDGTPETNLATLPADATALASWRKAKRLEVLDRTARGAKAAADAENALEMIRWIDQVGYHFWRIATYLARGERPPGLP